MTSVMIATLFYRIVTLMCGFGFAFLGYRLFCLGLTKNAGEFRAAAGEKSLLMKSVAPGIWFAFFGTLILFISIWKGVDFTLDTSLVGARSSVPTKTADSSPETNAVGELLKLDPEVDLDNHPQRMQRILGKLMESGSEALDNQEKQLLDLYLGKLKARITAKTSGTES